MFFLDFRIKNTFVFRNSVYVRFFRKFLPWHLFCIEEVPECDSILLFFSNLWEIQLRAFDRNRFFSLFLCDYTSFFLCQYCWLSSATFSSISFPWVKVGLDNVLVKILYPRMFQHRGSELNIHISVR